MFANKGGYPLKAKKNPFVEPLKGKKRKCVINLISLVSSEMPCLRSFHGDHGVPWWLIDTQGAIHLYTGCVRGRAAGTSAPTTNPKCKSKGNACALQCPLHACSVSADDFLHFIPPRRWSDSGNFLFVSLLPNALIVLADAEITSYCAVECSNEFTQSFSERAPLWYDERKIQSALIASRCNNLFPSVWEEPGKLGPCVCACVCVCVCVCVYTRRRGAERCRCLSHGPALWANQRVSPEHQQQSRGTL